MTSATMVATQPPPSDHLTLESIPAVDLRLLTQSELTALSFCSSHAVDLRRVDDVIIPKIDRSVFNESAGSRKQTFSRLRLAPRSSSGGNNPNPNPNSNPDNDFTLPELPVLDAERLENSRIVTFFKSLFNLDRGSGGGVDDDVVDDVSVSGNAGVNRELALVPVSVAYGDTVTGPVSYHNEVVIDGNGKRKRGRKPKTEITMTSSVGLGGTVDENDHVEVEVEDDAEVREEREKVLVNKNGAVVNLKELGKVDDVFAEEIKRLTQGKETAEELLRFVTDLEGVWGSSRKKRKIIDANLFGDALPVGWKVLIAIKKKQGRAWVFCRRYLSPNGQEFVSCKEVSSYLLSLTGPQELEEQPTVQDPNIPMDGNVVEKNVAEIETKVVSSVLPDSSQSYVRENLQKDLHISPNQEKQVIVSKDVHVGELHTASASALKCHKCSSPFNEKNELLNHLMSCHKRKRRKFGEPIVEDVLVKDGKYECQFCDKFFIDRGSYFGHIGQHVKNYARSTGGMPGWSAKKKTSQPLSVDKVPITVSKTIELAELNTEAVSIDQVPITISKTIQSTELNAEAPTASSEMNSNTVENTITASPDPERNLEIGRSDQNSFFHQKELSVEGAQNIEDLADELFGKDDTLTTNYDTMEVDHAADFSNVIPDDCFGSDNVLSDDNNDLCKNSQEINATDYLSSAISKPTDVAVENAEVSLSSDSKQLVDSNDSFVTVNAMGSGGILPSEFDLPTDIEENKSSPMPAYDSLVNKELGHDYFEDVMVGDDGGITDGSGSGDIDVAMGGEDDVEDSQNLKELSVPQREEESCGATMSKIDHMVSNASDFNLERGTQTSLSAGQQAEIEMQNRRHGLAGLVEVTPNTDRITLDRHSDSDARCGPKSYASSYFENEAVRGSEDRLVQATGSRGFHVEETRRPENRTVEVLNNKGEEQMNLFFTSESSDAHLNANSMTINDQSRNDVSNVIGAFGTFVEDKQPQVAKSLFSCLSMNEHGRQVSNVEGNVSSTATTVHFPRLNKVDNSRSKPMLDFSTMTDMNERFLDSAQLDTTPEDSSPFQLWGQQSCGLEDNQNRVYGGTQLESVSNNNSLNLIDIHRPSVGQNNLNELRMGEQRYSQQNETGVFNGSHHARMNDISHGNTLNLAVFSQQRDSRYNLNKPSINQQSYSVQHNNQGGGYSSRDQARQERVAYGNSLSLASVQPSDTRYSLNKGCAQQTVDTGYSLNKGYIDSMQGFSKLGNLGHSQDRDLMIGFGNNSGRPNQAATTEFLWRSTDGSILPGGLVDSSTSRGQSSGSFQAFDFLSDKGGNDLYSGNDKFDNMSNFDGLRSSVEPMEFSFMTTQDSNTQLEHSKDLQYNTGMDQSFGSLPNMMAGHVVNTLCVWCGNEFQQDPLACEMQAGSIGYLCPGCKARMSGQFL